MIALVLEVYGALCLFSLIAFLVWAAAAKLRPDLDELEFDRDELEKLKKLATCKQSDFDPPVEDLTRADCPARGPPRPVKRRRRRLFQTREPLFQSHKHRPI